MRSTAVGSNLSTVIAGLDPAIHRLCLKSFLLMDARVKPGHDELRVFTDIP
jgi:hypothetical protein